MNKLIKSKKFKGVYLRKREDGDIAIYFTYYNSKGNSTYQKVGLKSQGVTEKYAYQKRSETILTLKNGEIPHMMINNKEHKITLNEIANYYFTNHQVKSTKDRKNRYNNRIKKRIGDMNVHSITAKDLTTLQDTLKNDGLGRYTIIQYIELIGAIYNYYKKYKDDKLINPTLNIKKPSIDNRRRRILTEDEIDLVFNEVKSDFTLTLFFSLALTSAARKSTIFNYKIKDVNLIDKTINSYDFKNESAYVSFLDDRTIELIKIRMNQCSNNPNASLVYRPNITNIYKWVSNELKLVFDNLFNVGLSIKDSQNRVVIHSIRHTVLSHLGRKGANVFLLQKISNHKTLEMVSRYVELSEYSGRNEIQTLWENDIH